MEKPKIGEPCIGCGLCCLTQVCMNGSYVLGLVDRLGDYAEGRCPALKESPSGRYVCDIILNPNKYIKNKSLTAKTKSRYFAFLIGAGNGCDNLHEVDTEEEEDKLSIMLEAKKQDAEWLEKAQRIMSKIHE